MSTESKRRRLKNLMKLNPHCFWCDCLVILGNRDKGNHAKHPPNMATLDHVSSRNNKNWKRGKRNIRVLSCSECNQKRQIKETRLLPIEELWKRSGHRYQKPVIDNMKRYIENKARLLICDLFDIQVGALRIEDNEDVKKAIDSITQIVSDVQGKK